MANEAYRAVFLRVHPTGKVVLSLTTDEDGKESQYAEIVAGELGIPPLDVKVVPPTPTASAPGTASTRRRPTAPRPRSPARAARSATRARCSPGWRWRRRPTAWRGRTARGWRVTESDPTQLKTLEDVALYAHGTGELPPGVEGGLDAQTVYRD